MSTISAVTYDDAFAYTSNQNLSFPAAAFISQTSGTLTLTTPNKNVISLQVNAGLIYPIAFINISLNGSNSGPIVALRAQPFKGTT